MKVPGETGFETLSEAERAALLKQPSWKKKEWGALMAKAHSQQGVVTRPQVLAAGFTRAEWMRVLRLGWLNPIERGLYEVAPPLDWYERQLHTTLLALGEGVVSHRAAGRLFGLWGIDGYPLEFTVRGRLPVREAIVHRQPLPDDDVILRRGFRVTSLVRTVVDLASVLHSDSLAIAFEMARRLEPKFIAAIEKRLASDPDPDPTGLVGDLIAEASERKVLLDSPPEVWAWRWMRLARLELPEPHHKVAVQGGRTLTLDFAYPKDKVAIEILGWAHHGGQQKFEKDASRFTKLSQEGWVVIFVTYKRLTTAFQDVVTEIRLTLARQRAKAKRTSW